MQRTLQPPLPSQSHRHPPTQPGFMKTLAWLLVGIQAGLALVMVVAVVTGLGMIFFYNTGRVMPGVSALGVDLGRLTVDEAAARLRDAWDDQAFLTVTDGDRRWTLSPADLGLGLDAAQTAVRAGQVGRGDDGLGGAIQSVLSGREVHPALTVDVGRARAGFDLLAQYANIPAKNANIRFNGADFQIVNALPGRQLDVETMLSALVTDPGAALADGKLELVMFDTYPEITDVSDALAMAKQIQGRPFALRGYDPITNETFDWTIEPDPLAFMLEASHDERRRTVLSLREEDLTAYLQGLSDQLGGGRGISVETAITKMREGLSNGSLAATVRVSHGAQEYTVQSGDTFNSIARKFGVLPRMILEANPGIDPSALYVGMTVTIPSPDPLIPLEPVMNKRVVVDMSDLRMYIYENGQLIQDWPTSTGIPSSPTNPGVFQIQGRYELAYAAGWDLYMPHFMDVYEAAPGFFNGIHGLPTTGSGRQAVWRDALGNYDTSYGCIILGLEEAAWLYNWAEDGVIVEIRD